MTDKPWLTHYDEGVPHTLAPYPAVTLPDLLRRSAEEEPDLTALLFMGQSLSFGELERQSDAFAVALYAGGVRKGDRVALLLPNSPQLIIAEFAVWKVGAIAVMLNPLFTEHEIERLIVESDTESAIVLVAFYEKINHFRSKTPLKRVVLTAMQDYLPKMGGVAQSGQGEPVTLRHGDMMMREMIESHRDKERPVVAISPKDPALFLFSGGTTGKPKCAVGRHEASIINGMQIEAWFSPVLGEERMPVMLNLPLYHVYPQVAIMSFGFIRRYPLVLMPDPRDIETLIATIKRLKVGLLPGVPTLFNALAAHPALLQDPEALHSLKLIISAAATLHVETRRRFEAFTQARIIEAYGLTEAMVSPVGTPVLGMNKTGAVGLPLPDIDVRIVDADTGITTLPAGEVGEIVMRSPQLMTGYWRDPEETRSIMRDGWLFTGDLGYLDDDGFLFVADRKKDVIKPSGFQVWPREVEEVIATHPSVLEVGVAGVPDEYRGEAVKAWVVLRPGCRLDAARLNAWCRQELVAYKVPKHIEFCEHIPKTLVGKVLRRVLVERHNEEQRATGQ